MPQSPYTPWKPDWKRSWALLYLLPTLLFMTGYALPETRLYALCALILSAMLGCRLRVRVKARRHGQAVEATFVSKAIPALARAGFHVEAGRMTQVGDIELGARRGRCRDLAAKCPNQLARLSVERIARAFLFLNLRLGGGQAGGVREDALRRISSPCDCT